MKPANFDKLYKKVSHRKPFRAYEVELVSGATISVQHPEALAYGNGMGVFFDPQGGFELFDAEEVNSLRCPPKNSAKTSK